MINNQQFSRQICWLAQSMWSYQTFYSFVCFVPVCVIYICKSSCCPLTQLQCVQSMKLAPCFETVQSTEDFRLPLCTASGRTVFLIPKQVFFKVSKAHNSSVGDVHPNILNLLDWQHLNSRGLGLLGVQLVHLQTHTEVPLRKCNTTCNVKYAGSWCQTRI